MRYNSGKPVDKRKRLYYPYCGYHEGFCLKRSPYTEEYPNGKGCKFFRANHPITKIPPQMLR